MQCICEHSNLPPPFFLTCWRFNPPAVTHTIRLRHQLAVATEEFSSEDLIFALNKWTDLLCIIVVSTPSTPESPTQPGRVHLRDNPSTRLLRIHFSNPMQRSNDSIWNQKWKSSKLTRLRLPPRRIPMFASDEMRRVNVLDSVGVIPNLRIPARMLTYGCQLGYVSWQNDSGRTTLNNDINIQYINCTWGTGMMKQTEQIGKCRGAAWLLTWQFHIFQHALRNSCKKVTECQPVVILQHAATSTRCVRSLFLTSVACLVQ